MDMLAARRAILSLLGTGAASAVLGRDVTSGPMHVPARSGISVIAFDGLAVFDPRPIASLAESLFPGQGAALTNAWRARQFEYTWLRTMTGSYADFWHVTADALAFAAEWLKLDMSGGKRDRLMGAYLEMRAWPDAALILKGLKRRGLALALLSNFTAPMLDTCVRNASLQGVFDTIFSTDLVKAYKPDGRAYQMATDAFGLRRDQIAFVAFAGWDAVGAKAFGYPTYWANRLGLPSEKLGLRADATGADLNGVAAFLGL
jgi:2-haloacid dehalogenase